MPPTNTPQNNATGFQLSHQELDQAASHTKPNSSSSPAVIDSDTENFTNDVIEASKAVPILVDFWAPWCGPCKQLTPALEKIAENSGGLIRLVKINIDDNQQLAQQLRIQTVPTVYAFKDGQPVDAFSGALPESQIKTFVDKLTGGAKPPIEAALDQGENFLDEGDFETAAAIFAEVQAQDPENEQAIGGMIRASIASGTVDTAVEMVSSLPDLLKTKPAIKRAISALELSQQGQQDDGQINDLIQQLEKNSADHEARLALATAYYNAGNPKEAIETVLELIRQDRHWNDAAGRTQLLKFFEALGPTHDLTTEGRRKLSTILFS